MILADGAPIDIDGGVLSTAKVALGLNRNAVGFEKSPIAYAYQQPLMANIEKGHLLETLRTPPENQLFNQGKPLGAAEKNEILMQFALLKNKGASKKACIEQLTKTTGRGYWSLSKIIDDAATLRTNDAKKIDDDSSPQTLFSL